MNFSVTARLLREQNTLVPDLLPIKISGAYYAVWETGGFIDFIFFSSVIGKDRNRFFINNISVQFLPGPISLTERAKKVLMLQCFTWPNGQ